MDYSYDMHGWLLSINDPTQLNHNKGSEKDFFGMSLAYDALGNITTWNYQNAKRKNAYTALYDILPRGMYNYGFGYDDLNRLTTANLAQASNGVLAMTHAYDHNGNLQNLSRTYNGAIVDNMTYNYAPPSGAGGANRLQSINDTGTNPAPANSSFFKDGNTAYTYDANGNLITDSGKGISTPISYNHLNLPKQIVMPTGTSTYTYTAAGQKVQANFGTNKRFDYVAGLVYKNDSLEFIPTAEGRILPPTKAKNPDDNVTNAFYRYEYHLKDHLGNLRLACRCAEKASPASPKDSYPLIAVQENHYDPWGLALPLTEQSANLAGSPEHRWQYNGKEKVPDLGWYEYGFRWYAPDAARFLQIDPMAEKGRRWSPYVYGFGNSVRFIDTDGRWPELPNFSELAQRARNYVVNKAVETVTNVAIATVNAVKQGVKDVLKNTEVAFYGKAEVKLTAGPGGAAEIKGYGIDARYQHRELLQGELNVDTKQSSIGGNYANKDGLKKDLSSYGLGVPIIGIGVEPTYEKETIRNSKDILSTKKEIDGGISILTPIGLPVGAGLKLSQEIGVNGNTYETRGEMLRTGLKIGLPFTMSLDLSIGVRATYKPE